MEHLRGNGGNLSRASSSSSVLWGDQTFQKNNVGSITPSIASGRPDHPLPAVSLAGEVLTARSGCESRSDGREKREDFTIDAYVHVLGDSGSGRTSLASAAAGVASRLRTASDQQNLYSGFFSAYIYRRSMSRRKESLRFGVFDPGPLPVRGGGGRFFLGCTRTVIITLALTNIKQRLLTEKSIFSVLKNGGKDMGGRSSVIVHPKDRKLLCDLLAMVATRVPPDGCHPSILLVGTHMDLLSDHSRCGVERVLAELRSICSSYLSLLSLPLLIHSVFAVSFVDGACIAENRGGPSTLSAMWSFVCDLMLKSVVAHRFGNDRRSIDSEEIWRKSHLAQNAFALGRRSSLGEFTLAPNEAVCDGENDGLRQNSFLVSSADCVLDDVNTKAARFILRVKADRKIVIVYLDILWGLLYALGLSCKEQLKFILQKLRYAGQLLLFNHRPRGLSRHDLSICLHPHLVNRAQSIIFSYSRFTLEPSEENGRLLADVGLDECSRCDPNRDVLRGVFSHALFCRLAPSLNLDHALSETTEIFTMLLLLSDTAFIRRCRRYLAADVGEANSSLLVHTGGDIESENFVSSVGSSDLGPNKSKELFESMNQMGLVEFVVPSLVRTECPVEVINCVRRLASVRGVTDDDPQSHVLTRVLGLRGCPPDFFPMLISRLQRYICPFARLFLQALWLGDLTLNEEAVCPPRVFIYFWSSEWIGGVMPSGLNDAVSLLEIHAFSDIGYLPLVLFVDKIIRQLKKLIRDEFPGMFTWVPENAPPSIDPLVDRHTSDEMSRKTKRLCEVTSIKDLDEYFFA